MNAIFTNPFRPGAGHRPPYLAGRKSESNEFVRLLQQDVILENLILTGLRGIGKTVLLDTFKPLAIGAGWRWVGTDLSESSSISEDRLVLRLLTDLSVVTAAFQVGEAQIPRIGFDAPSEMSAMSLDFRTLESIYTSQPGLPSDKLKAVLELVWQVMESNNDRGLVFAYDEAQNLSDQAEKDQYPLSLLLDVFQSIQRKGIPFLLVLVGLPTLFPKLVEARTYSERMFRVVFLDSLSEGDSREAILQPIADADCPVKLDKDSIGMIVGITGGYPYFIQFVCREVYDTFVQGITEVPLDSITRKLDTDFFAGRWAKATDRQRELLTVIANLDHGHAEFTVQEVSRKSKELLEKPFNPSHISQMLSALATAGLIYKNRHGNSFGVKRGRSTDSSSRWTGAAPGGCRSGSGRTRASFENSSPQRYCGRMEVSLLAA